MNPLNPKKLILSKWTAVAPFDKNKHFLVSKVIAFEQPLQGVEAVELEAVFSKTVIRMDWRLLRDTAHWRQGWV
jgi:hypothetical protein